MENILHVLILGDQLDDAELVMLELRRFGYDPVWEHVQCEDGFLAGLAWTPDVIISGYSIPDCDALCTLHLLREQGVDTPFIIVSGTISEGIAVAAMREGVDDYLLKDHPGRLGHAVARAVEQHRLRTEQKRTEEARQEASRCAISEHERLLGQLNHLAQEVGTAEDLTTIYRALRTFIQASVPCNGLFVSHFDSERQEGIYKYVWNEGTEVDPGALPPMPMTDNPYSQAMATGEVVVTNDPIAAFVNCLHWEPGVEHDSRPPQSSVIVPMSGRGRVLGGFEVQSAQPAAYTTEHLLTLKLAANLVAMAAEKVQLLQQEREQRLAAEKSEERYRLISELISEYAYAINVQPNGTLEQEWITDAYGRITGCSPKELSQPGRWRQVVHTEDQAIVDTHLAQVQSGKRAVSEYRILTRQGEVRWLCDFSYLVDNEAQPRVSQVLGVAQDITERRQLEEALRQQESLLRSVLDSLPIGIWIADADGMIVYGNPAGQAIWQGTRYVGRSDYSEYKGWWMDTGNRIEAEEWALARAITQGETSLDEEIEIECFDSSRKIILNSAVPLRGVDGQITGAIVVNQDITERKHAQEEIKRSKALLHIAGEAARLGGWIVEIPNNSVVWSDEVCAIHEVPPGTSPSVTEAIDYYAPEWRDRITEVLDACIRQGIPFDEEMQIITAKGRRVWVRAIGKAVLDTSGAIIRVQGAFQDIAEKKQTAEEMSHLITRMTTTLESITDAFFMLDREWRFTYMNSEAERLLQRMRADLLGKVIWDEFGAAIQYKFYQEYHRALRDHCTVVFEEIYPPLGLWVEVHAYPSDEGLAVYFRDISKRKHGEEALHQRLAELEALYSISSALRITLTSDEALPILLDKALEALNTDVGSIWLHTRERDELYAAVTRGWFRELSELSVKPGENIAGSVFASRQTYISIEFRNDPIAKKHEHTQPGWGGACVPILVGDEPVGVLFVALSHPRQITPVQVKLLEALAEMAGTTLHRLRLWQEIQEQTRRIQSIMDIAPTGMLLLDTDGGVHLANPMAERHLAVLAKASGALYPDTGQTLSHLGDRCLAELLLPPPKGERHEIRVEERTYEVIARPMAENPNPRYWVLLLNEVTAERAQQRYQQAQERLATVGVLAAGIAHDFNNILGVIVLYVGILRRIPGLSDRQRSQLGTIDDQADHAANLIRQILDFSRCSVLHLAPVDLLPLGKELVKLLERTLPEYIRLELTHDRGQYVVNGDSTLLQQALLNLALNARDAMPAGGLLHFRLSALHVAPGQIPPLPDMEPGDWIQMEVIDTGRGIAPEHLPHLFEPFFTTKDAGEGTGLGLAQVYGIIKQHTGAIDVHSQVGQGTTFTIYLPLLAKPAIEVNSAFTTELHSGRGETLLLVEDNHALQEAVANILEELGYRVLTAVDGVEALQVLAKQDRTVALVISDLIMPRMGGMALYRQLQKRYPGIKRLFMTGYPPEETDYPELLQAGETVIQKPFTPTDLAASVRTVLAVAGVAESQPAPII